jgi:hypothetical protein
MTLAEFLTWEERQPTRHEFDGFQPVAMTEGTVAHNRIMCRLHPALERGLDGQPCEPFGPDVQIITVRRCEAYGDGTRRAARLKPHPRI